ncbi:MAG: ABC transporter permease, partial [Bacteroidetes bacterium]|nr:ABC transporter permease [Bacteroidota bacterium]
MPDPTPCPPRLAQWLFERLLSPEYDAVLGDLEEDYHDRAAYYGSRRAALHYGLDGLRTAPALFLHNLIWHSIMLKNYLLIAFRNLRKYKGFSAINIFGLAVSMSVCLLIIALVRDQKSYDTFHEKAERIYRVTAEVEEPYGRFSMATSPGPVAPALLAQHPGVERAVRFSGLGGHATYGDQTFDLEGLYADPTFFEVFDFVLAQGDERTALSTPYSLVLTRATATKFFGEADPMGQVIQRDDLGDFTVTGVLEDLPYKSHFAFEALASFATVEARQAGGIELNLDNWNISSRFYNYLLLAEGASPAEVEALAADLAARNHTDAERPIPELRLQALTRINLGAELSNQIGTTMPASNAYVLAFFGLILILIAVFNYISLSVARSLKRAREIGIRKVVGAQRGQIVRQFLSEAVIVALLALVLAGFLLVGLMSGFNNLRGFQDDLDMARVTINLARDGGLFLLFIGFAVGIGVMAGLYPAFKMSSYVPTRVLKGLMRVEGFSGVMLRKMLIVVQFSLSIIAVITTLVIYQQYTFLMQAEYGFGESQIVNVELQGVAHETLRNELMRLPGVVNVAAMSSPPTSGSKTWTDIQAEGMAEPILIQFYSIDEHFLDQYRLKLIAGRDFSMAFSTGEEEPILLTKKALPALGLGTPQEAVGKVITFDTFP